MLYLKNTPNMKNIILVITLLALLTRCSPYKNITAMEYPVPFQFTIIDSVQGSKNDLYVRANEWMAKAFVSSKSVIQMQDKEAGKIIGKAVINIPLIETNNLSETVNYTISIDVKDGRYRCVLSDFYHEGVVYAGGRTPDLGSLERKTATMKIAYGDEMNITDKLYYIKNTALKDSQRTVESLKKAMSTVKDW